MGATTLLCLSSRYLAIGRGNRIRVDRFHINYYFENVLFSIRTTFVGRLICNSGLPTRMYNHYFPLRSN